MSTASLAGKRILIIEDEYFIAADLKRALQKEGAVPVGPTGSLQSGLALAREELDLALLDVHLAGERSYLIADLLMQRAVPFAFLTGYDDWALPEPYRHVPRFAKPYAMTQVISGLAALSPTGLRS